MRLVEIGVIPSESEMMIWQANCETIQQQITMRIGRSVEEIYADRVLGEILDSIVERMPRESDIFRMAAFQSDDRLVATRDHLIQGVLEIVEYLVSQNPGALKFANRLFFLEVFTLFSQEKASSLLDSILKNNFLKKSDFENYVMEFGCVLELFKSLCEKTKKDFEKSEEMKKCARAKVVVELLVTVGSSVRDIVGLVGLLKMKININWNIKLVELFGKIEEMYDYASLFEIASAIDTFPLKKVFGAFSFARESLVRAVDELFPCMVGRTKMEFEQRMSNEYLRLIGMCSELGLCENLKCISKFEKLSEIGEELLRQDAIRRMNKCGYFESLGDSGVTVVNQEINSIREILPHISPEFAHLVLRNYSYETELALSNLLSKESLPLELLRLETVKLDELDLEEDVQWPPLDFSASGEIEKLIFEKRDREREEEKRNKGKKEIISLAVPVNNTVEVDEKEELRKRARQYKEEVISKLNAIRKVSPSTSVAPDGEVLVPMMTSKKYSALNSLKLNEADKIAIRPTYEKFKYVTPDENGMYDDEYDDESEIREFNIERLNEELVSSDDDVEAEETSQLPSNIQGNRGRGGSRGNGRGRGRGRGKTTQPSDGYTGGRERQMKERHKSDFKQRGADKKMRGVY